MNHAKVMTELVSQRCCYGTQRRTSVLQPIADTRLSLHEAVTAARAGEQKYKI